jgi:hypothetical protein
VLERIRWALANQEAYAAARAAQLDEPALCQELAQVDASLADYTQRLVRWDRAYEISAITLERWLDLTSEINASKAALTAQVRELRRRIDAISAPPPLDQYAEGLAFLDRATPAQLQLLARALIREIRVSPGKELSLELSWL